LENVIINQRNVDHLLLFIDQKATKSILIYAHTVGSSTSRQDPPSQVGGSKYPPTNQPYAACRQGCQTNHNFPCKPHLVPISSKCRATPQVRDRQSCSSQALRKQKKASQQG